MYTQVAIIALLFASLMKDLVICCCCKKQTKTAKKDTHIIKETVSKRFSRCLENPENRGYTPLITKSDTTLTKSKETIEMKEFAEKKTTEERYQIPSKGEETAILVDKENQYCEDKRRSDDTMDESLPPTPPPAI